MRKVIASILAATLAGCAALLDTLPLATSGVGKTTANPAASVGAVASPDALRGPIYGTVLDQAGQPARNVAVTAFLSQSSPLIGNVGAGLAGNSAAAYRTLLARRISAGMETKTDENGRFVIKPELAGTFNVEAVGSEQSKAWQSSVTWDGPGKEAGVGQLKLAPTGSITGRVKAAVGSVSDFSNTHVYIPGSSYAAITRSDGTYTISSVPEGKFELAAYNINLGDAVLPDEENTALIRVRSEETTSAPSLVLKAVSPELTQMTAPDSTEPTDNAAPGAVIALHGKGFGFNRGTRFEVRFIAATAVEPERVSESLILVKVPERALNGDILLFSGNLASKGLPFRLLKRFKINRTSLAMRVGDTFDLGGDLEAYDTDDIRIRAVAQGSVKSAPPNLAWVADSRRADVTAAGVVTALSEGEVKVTASAGSLAPHTIAITVFPAGAALPTPEPTPTPALSSSPTPGPMPTPTPAPTPIPTPTPTPTPTPVPPIIPAAIGKLAPDDKASASETHDYQLTVGGVTSTFVWIPVFTTYQIINPVQAGCATCAVGHWVKDAPASGAQNVDWAAETFGGFYAAKFEASHADATPGDPVTGAGATAGTSTTLKVERYCVPWTMITWASAASTAANYLPGKSHLMRDDEWTALAVWTMIHNVRVYGNNGETSASSSYVKPKDKDDPNITFLDDPTFTTTTYSANGVERALTGSATASDWGAGVDKTTHTGTTGGVSDLNGNVRDWTLNLGTTATGGYFTIYNPATLGTAELGFTVGAGVISGLATDPRWRRFGLPSATGGTSGPFYGDFLSINTTRVNNSGRGGYWGSGTNGGPWSLDVALQPTYSNPSVGFRPALVY